MWFISGNCPGLIDALPVLIHDADGNIEDVLKVDSETNPADDFADSARYGMKSMLSPGHKPKEMVFKEKLDAIPNMHQKSMAHRFMQKKWDEEKKHFHLRRRAR